MPAPLEHGVLGAQALGQLGRPLVGRGDPVVAARKDEGRGPDGLQPAAWVVLGEESVERPPDRARPEPDAVGERAEVVGAGVGDVEREERAHPRLELAVALGRPREGGPERRTRLGREVGEPGLGAGRRRGEVGGAGGRRAQDEPGHAVRVAPGDLQRDDGPVRVAEHDDAPVSPRPRVEPGADVFDALGPRRVGDRGPVVGLGRGPAPEEVDVGQTGALGERVEPGAERGGVPPEPAVEGEDGRTATAERGGRREGHERLWQTAIAYEYNR